MTNDFDLHVEYVPLDSIKPYARNAKLHPEEQINQIVESIRTVGFRDPIGVWRGEIVEGHGRYLAAKKMGLDTVPVIRLDDMTDDERRAYALIHNQLTMNSGFDIAMRDLELGDIELDMEPFGFELDGEADPEEVVEDDYEPEPPKEPKAKRGDIYQLGRHRLMCGDSTDKDAVKQLFDGKQPFCIVTDPPYCSGGFQEAGKKSGSIGTRDTLMIANDTLSTRGYMLLIKSVILAAGDIGIAYLFTDWRMWTNLFDCMEASGFCVRNMIVWDKGTPGFGAGWRAQHEICLMASRAVQMFNPHKARGNVIKCNRTGNVNHPTEKPVELIAKIIDVTDFAEAIYDPFSGSGTTLIACEHLGRDCYAMELDPKYVDVIIDRWERFTRQKAELITEG